MNESYSTSRGTNLIKRIKGINFSRLAIIAAILLAMLYACQYFMSLSNNIDKLPVALVNNDRGASVAGEDLQAGDEVVSGLQDNKEITWDKVGTTEAQNGVESGKYYFALEIPEDFSEAVASPTSDSPHNAQLNALYNDANGYFSRVIGSTVMTEVLDVVNSKIGSETVDKLLIGIGTAGAGLQAAADGAGQLNEGAVTLTDGLGKAKEASGKLSDGSNQLATGAGKLHAAADQLADGTGTLATQVNGLTGPVLDITSELESLDLDNAVVASGILAQGADTMVQELTSAIEQGAQVQDSQSDQLMNMASTMRDLGIPELPDQLVALAQSARANGVGSESQIYVQSHKLRELTESLNYQLNDPSSPLKSGAEMLSNGELSNKVRNLRDGVNKLNDGMHTLDTGIGSLGESVGRLNTGLHGLDEANGKLVTGSSKLMDGTGQLAGKLSDGASAAPKWTNQQRIKATDVISNPVAMQNTSFNGLSNLGASIAPFFFCLALFVASIILFILMPPVRGIHRGESFSTTLKSFLRQTFKPAVIITGIAAILAALTSFVLGFKPASFAGLVGVLLLSGLVLMAMSQACVAFFGVSKGRVISIVGMLVMLLTSGGLFPIQTQGALAQFLCKINPMTYSVNALREVMYGYYDDRLNTAIIVLVISGLAAMALTILGLRRKAGGNHSSPDTQRQFAEIAT